MVLDSLGIHLGYLGIHADREEEAVHDLVALSALDRELVPRLGELDGLVGLCRGEPVALEAFDRPDHCYMGDAELFGEVSHPADPVCLDQIGDCLHIILSDFGGVISARSLVGSGFGSF